MSDSARGIVVTLQSVFPQCRGFHDYNEQVTDESLQTDFINWVCSILLQASVLCLIIAVTQVFFCTPSEKDIVFRPAIEADYLGSWLREQVLSTFPAHEISLDLVTRDLTPQQLKKYLLTDNANPLEDWQKLEALNHWKLMREILPDVYWETY